MMREPDKLAEWFTWEEVSFSETATRHGIDNRPPIGLEEAIRFTAAGMDTIRNRLQMPVRVSSWYRCLELNRLIKSKDSSQHVRGEAVDFTCSAYGSPRVVFELLRKESMVRFDQIILEFVDQHGEGGWVHCSFRKAEPRRQALIIDTFGTRAA